jgi:glycine dehydrogenase subunit 2
MGIDVMHFNLHKTFATPHGGGGPGAGPVGVTEELAPFLPVPMVVKEVGKFRLDYDRPRSVGRVKAFYGNFGILVRAWAYIRSMGPQGLRHATEMAVLNANYIRARLEGVYHLPHQRRSMHEVVFSDRDLGGDCHTLDVEAPHRLRLSPDHLFPAGGQGVMVKPTETECVEVLDKFCDAMLAIAREARNRTCCRRRSDPNPPVRRDGGGYNPRPWKDKTRGRSGPFVLVNRSPREVTGRKRRC